MTMGKIVAVLEDCVHPPLSSYTLWFRNVLFYEPQWFFQTFYFPYKASINNMDNSTSSLIVQHRHKELSWVAKCNQKCEFYFSSVKIHWEGVFLYLLYDSFLRTPGGRRQVSAGNGQLLNQVGQCSLSLP